MEPRYTDEELKKTIESLDRDIPREVLWTPEKTWENLNTKLSKPAKTRTLLLKYSIRVAAGVLLLLTAGWWILHFANKPETDATQGRYALKQDYPEIEQLSGIHQEKKENKIQAESLENESDGEDTKFKYLGVQQIMAGIKKEPLHSQDSVENTDKLTVVADTLNDPSHRVDSLSVGEKSEKLITVTSNRKKKYINQQVTLTVAEEARIRKRKRWKFRVGAEERKNEPQFVTKRRNVLFTLPKRRKQGVKTLALEDH